MSYFIKLNRIYFTYSNLSEDLISDVSASFHEGWTSICGPNGSGKTTFFKLVSGELKPTSGSLSCQGRLFTVPQSTESPPESLEDFRFDYDKLAIRLRDHFGIEDDWFERWKSLSIGERKRLQIAFALSQNADILLVDEPTNHVDRETRVSILDALKKFRGVGIMISHDRLLLNELCQGTSFLDGGKLKHFSAPYDEAKLELANVGLRTKAERENLTRELSKVSRAAKEQKRKVAEGREKLSKRKVDKNDHDAKDKINKARVSGADFADGRKKKILDRRGDALEEKIKETSFKKEYNLGVFFETLPRVRRLHFKEEILKYDFLTIEQPEITLDPGSKLAITGENGAGKSTLLKALLDKFPHPYSYGPQEFTKKDTKRLTEELAELESDVKGKVMTLVSCFGSSPKSLARGSLPSPGVWQKIVIARAIVEAVPFLILDEPTNHMDLKAIEILEEALKIFKGTLICISHDDSFIEKVCDLELHLEKESNVTKSRLFYRD